LFTDQLLDILIDKLTDERLVVRFGNDGRKVTESSLVIVIN